MDKSLDEVIKENPRKFNRKRGQLNARRNNSAANGKKNNNKHVSPLLAGVSKNSTGRVGKKQPNRVVGQKGNNKVIKTKAVGARQVIGQVDARNKLLAKNRLKIVDARDKLAAITKKTTGDLRQKLSSKRPQQQLRSKSATLKAQLKSLQGVRPLVSRDLGRSPLTRTTVVRTVENELARFHAGPVHPLTDHYELLPPPPQYLYEPPYQHQAARSYSYVRSSAAMDLDPLPSASQRIQRSPIIKSNSSSGTTVVRSPVKTDQGHRVYVTNLHHKVTQDDIAELFGDVGPLARASLLRPGMAEVVYVHQKDAQKAVDSYHNRQLDGLPMHCSLAPSSYDSRRDLASSKPSMNPTRGNAKAHILPDISTIHKALFKKKSAADNNDDDQIFTVTLPKQEKR